MLLNHYTQSVVEDKYMNKQKLVIMRGLPASGKSTYAKQLVEEQGYKRINKDDLRAMIDNGKWSEKNEEEILNFQTRMIELWLSMHHSVVVDDTNFSERHIKRFNNIADNHKVEMEIKFIDTPLWECIERDSKREHPVGKKVIINMYNKYLRASVEGVSFEDNKELPECIICDVDGTLAYSPERSIYDYNKVDKDIPNKKLIEMLNKINVPIIIVSGRNDDCCVETGTWLYNNGVVYEKLLMRKTGDKRRDTEVKEEIYNEFIKDKYNVLTVFDDRPCVVRMWKRLNLMVCDVSRQDPRVDF